MIVMLVLWTLVGAAATVLVAPITGEEEVELVIIRKLVESGGPGWDSVMHRPAEVTTYLFTPQFLMEAIVSRLVPTELVGVYAKLRFVYVILAAASLFALARRSIGSPCHSPSMTFSHPRPSPRENRWKG